MMSAAILVTMGVEPTGVRPASSDLASDLGASFAKSFNERVGDPDLFQGKSSAGAAIALPSLKSAALAKTPDEVLDMPTGMKEKAIPTQKTSTYDELKSAVTEKIARPQAQAVAGLQEKETVGDSGAKEVESSAQVEKAADGVSADPSDPCAPHSAPVTQQVDDNLLPLIGIADANRPVVLSGGGLVVQKGTSNTAKDKEVASAKKTAEPRESVAMPKPVQKTIGAAAKAAVIEAKPAVVSSTESALSSVVVAVAAGSVPRTETGKTTEGLSEEVSGAAKPSMGISPVTADSSARKESARGVKANVIDSETVVTADENIALPKPSVDMEKMTSVAIPVRNDGDNKMESAPGPATATVHAVSGGAGISPGIVSGVFVMSGNTPGDLIAAKLPVGDVSAHPADLSAGSREQDGPGLVAASMDGMPRMVTATPTALEVGIPNGTHGWLKVRAEMADGGGINASVSAASSSGQEMLHRELPSLTAYLQQEKVAVNTVVVHTAAVGVELRGSGSGMNSGGSGQTPQKSNEGGEQRQDVGKGTLDRPDEAMGYQEDGEDGVSPLAMYAGGGSWLSVRA
jgi:hypothetical protein